MLFRSSITIPPYWKISGGGINKEVQKVVDNNPLAQFYGNEELTEALNLIVTRTRNYLKKATEVPISALDANVSPLFFENCLLNVLAEYLNTDLSLQPTIIQLLSVYIEIMIKTKRTLNVDASDIKHATFKLKEYEKHTVTDRLKNQSIETREIDTIFKHMKMGRYSERDLRRYDEDVFTRDKETAEEIDRLRRNEDDIGEEGEEELRLYQSTGYDDGDPYGEEEHEADD